MFSIFLAIHSLFLIHFVFSNVTPIRARGKAFTDIILCYVFDFSRYPFAFPSSFPNSGPEGKLSKDIIFAMFSIFLAIHVYDPSSHFDLSLML